MSCLEGISFELLFSTLDVYYGNCDICFLPQIISPPFPFKPLFQFGPV